MLSGGSCGESERRGQVMSRCPLHPLQHPHLQDVLMAAWAGKEASSFVSKLSYLVVNHHQEVTTGCHESQSTLESSL